MKKQKQEPTTESETPIPSWHAEKLNLAKSNWQKLSLVLVIIVIILAGGAYVANQQSPTPLPSPTPTPSATSVTDRQISNEEKRRIDAWIKENKLNEYGDPKDRVYLGGTPLFNEATGETIDRYDYIIQNHPDRPWNK